ncbi:hypothetical protein EOPP23_15150 [Endozoicomonas sp. OPT23]|uniref:hypothetical protein n=1 Tax=Endozoicomonas sp. OPT23 TaxID=2072845 RepID=UPI00129B05B7|nr:hypothetical protein [Endozoicomonas sp. OPT23]MRI34325.1 hypothetical protein [Endozoicomonas sp. OPT23]
MILITSGAYISADLISDIGRLPPAFLPVGNRRLFTLQLEQVKKIQGDIYLSIPEDYEISHYDRVALEKSGVILIQIPEGLTIGESILYCWNSTGKQYNKLQILHGDTLIQDQSFETLDVVSIAQNQGYYHRATVSRGNLSKGMIKDAWAGDDEWVLSGYFAFSKPHLLIQGIVKNHGDFVQGLKHYSQQTPLFGQESGTWLDFGHINTFYQSRTLITTQRAFNEMQISLRTVTKASSKAQKMRAEANWFNSLPGVLRIYTPHLLKNEVDSDHPSYSLEYLYLLPLNDLFVYGQLPANSWRQIFRSCKGVSQKFRCYKPDQKIECKKIESLYLPKTLGRLQDFIKQVDFDIHKTLSINGRKVPSLDSIAKETAELISTPDDSSIGISHGDYCFSNILYDPRIESIKLVDPRGIDNDGTLTIYGDARYDIAKLHHSVIGLYDMIIANRFELSADIENGQFSLVFPDQKRIEAIQEIYRSIFFSHPIDLEKEILAITIHLFISMLPLHFDRPDGQLAMIANALRLYSDLMDMDSVKVEAVT